MRVRLLALLALLLVLPVGTPGCDLTASDTSDVTGSWTGSALLPNGFAASADLSQSGTTVGGTLRISGVFAATDLSGDIDDLGRLSWTLQSGYERWSGILSIDEAEDRMEGSINLDAGSCPDTRGASGTLRLARSSG